MAETKTTGYYVLAGILGLVFAGNVYAAVAPLVHRNKEDTEWEFEKARLTSAAGVPVTPLLARTNLTVEGELHGGKGGDHHFAIAIVHIVLAVGSAYLLWKLYQGCLVMQESA